MKNWTKIHNHSVRRYRRMIHIYQIFEINMPIYVSKQKKQEVEEMGSKINTLYFTNKRKQK